MESKKINYKEYDKLIAECKIISIQKNKDYGMDGLTKFGSKGMLIRLNDKIGRLNNLLWDNVQPLVNDEKIEDTIKDMINYLIYMALHERGTLEDGN